MKHSFITENYTRKHGKVFCISRSVCTICENAKQLQFVSRCPTDISEWTIAANEKQCENLPDDCPERNTNPLVYHCVLHEVFLTPVDVCARRYLSQGKTVWYKQ